MSKNKTNEEILGALGEKIVLVTFKSLGLNAELSQNKYDQVKDLIIENETAEVKTRVLIKKFQAFCIEPNQWNKLDNVSRLFFVEVPDYDNPVIVYESIEKYYFTNDFSGGIKRMYPVNRMRKFCIIQDNELARALRNYTDSKYIKRGENDRAPFSTSFE